MSRSTRACLVVGTLLWMGVAASACRGCRTQPPTAAPTTSTIKPDPSGKPPNIKMDYGKALDAMDDMFGVTLYPGDCKPGTGPAALENKSDREVRPPCEFTNQYRKRREAAEKKRGVR